MTDALIRVGGAVILWGLAPWSKREPIKEGLFALGLGKFCPEPRTPAAALKDALGEIFTASNQLIRPLKTKTGFAVIEEARGEHGKGNEYVTLHTAQIDDDLRIDLSPYDTAVSADIVNRYNTHRGLLHSSNVAVALVNILNHFGGTVLRPNGSIYWLRDERLDNWMEVVKVIEPAGASKASNIYRLKNVMDAEAIRAVRDAITTEIQADVSRIEAEIRSGDLGELALEHRQDEAKQLAAKIKVYEDLLGEGLTTLTMATDRVLNSASAAALTLSMSNALTEQVA